MKKILSELRLYVCNHIIGKIPSHTCRLAFYRYIMGFKLDEGVAIHLGACFECARGLKIGKNSVINQNCKLDSRGSISIGSNVLISPETNIITADHDPKCNLEGRSRPVVIEDYVFVGTRAMILPGVMIHRGSVIAAGAVVTRDVSPFQIVAGIPARKIGSRCPGTDYSTFHRRLFH